MKSTGVTYALWLFLGLPWGAHRFYCGKTGSALLYIVTFGMVGVWWVADLFLIPEMVQTANDREQLRNMRSGQQQNVLVNVQTRD